MLVFCLDERDDVLGTAVIPGHSRPFEDLLARIRVSLCSTSASDAEVLRAVDIALCSDGWRRLRRRR